jgi:2-dehydropantoate 2-reductase
MKIAIFGAGGVGGYLGGLLAQINHDVYFIARGEHLEAMKTHGLQVKSIHGDFRIQPIKATSDPGQVGQVDYIVVAVKHFQLEEAASSMRPLIGSETTIVPLQNGVDAHDVLISTLGPDCIVGGFARMVSMIESPGIIRQPSMICEVLVGELDRTRSERCQRIVDAWADCGVQAIQPDDIYLPMWTKYVFIAAYGGVSSLAQVPSGELLGCPESRELLIRAMEEIEALARAKGIHLAPDVVSSAVATLEKFEPTTTSSTQRDVASGRPFELEAFSGTIARMGREMGIPTPVHEALYALLKPQLIRAQS